jgi:hypothetical protein
LLRLPQQLARPTLSPDPNRRRHRDDWRVGAPLLIPEPFLLLARVGAQDYLLFAITNTLPVLL